MSTRPIALALTIALILAGAATAQRDPAKRDIPTPKVTVQVNAPEPTPPASVEQVRDFIANHLDALVVECPPEREASEHAACYRLGSSADHHRWQLERWREGFSDLEWVNAWWEVEPGAVARLILLTPGDGLPRWVYALSITDTGDRHETIGWVLNMGAAD